MIWILFVAAIILLLNLRRVKEGERGVFYRLGRPTNVVKQPGIVFVTPIVDRLIKVPVEPFSVSLPPQSAITKDEIPIQLQASMDAVVTDPALAAGVRDWRVTIMSQLQEMMKEQLEELDFDSLDERLPAWRTAIHNQLNTRGEEIGVKVQSLQISNLSPRQKPVESID